MIKYLLACLMAVVLWCWDRLPDLRGPRGERPAPSPEPRPMHHVEHRMDPCALHGHAWGRQPAATRVEVKVPETWAVEVYHCQRSGCPEVWIHGYVWTPDEPMVIRRPGERA